MSGRSFVAFTVSGRSLALPLADVRRVVALPRLVTPAGAPAFLEGFFNLHGAEVAVLRADRLLDLGDEALGVYSPLLLLNGADPLALHVGAVHGIVKAPDVRGVGKDETFNSCVVGRFDDAGRSLYVLSASHMLLAEERARVASHRSEMERRLSALGLGSTEARRAV